MKKVILNTLIVPFMLLLNLVITYFAVMLFYPLEIVELKRLEVLTTEVEKGGIAQFELEFDKKLDYTPEVSWFLVDGIVIKLSDSGVRRPVGDQTYLRNIYIPDVPTIVEGQSYRLQADLTYPILGGVREIKYTWTSEPFLIKGGE